MNKIFKLLITLIFTSAALSAIAGKVELDSDNDIVWQAGSEGVEIEWSPDGSFNRVYSTFYEPVRFPDRAGISKAQMIAEENAKGNIVRFIKQNSSSDRLVTQIDTDTDTAIRTKSEAGDAISKETKRMMVSTVTQVTRSFASNDLRGVILLEKGYDQKKEEAWVKVGISRKTMNAAQSLSNAISAPSTGSSTEGVRSSGSPTDLRQGSEIRKSNQKDW